MMTFTLFAIWFEMRCPAAMQLLRDLAPRKRKAWCDTACGARNAWRRVNWFLRFGHTQPVELLIALVMLQSSLLLLVQKTNEILPFSPLFAVLLGVSGMAGLVGTSARITWMRLGFAGLGMFVRLWMVLLYIVRDWRDVSWLSYATGAIALGWILIRVSCDASKKGVLRREARNHWPDPERPNAE